VIRITIEGAGRPVNAAVFGTAEEVRVALKGAALVDAAALRGAAVAGLYSGRHDRPKSRMGNLARGIRAQVEDLPNGVQVRFGVLGSVPYARILEKGGPIKGGVPIVPVRKKALMWISYGGGRAIQMAKLWLGGTYKGARLAGVKHAIGAGFGLRFSKRVITKARTQRAMPYLFPVIVETEPARIARIRMALAAVHAAAIARGGYS